MFWMPHYVEQPTLIFPPFVEFDVAPQELDAAPQELDAAPQELDAAPQCYDTCSSLCHSSFKPTQCFSLLQT
jgi:hypothetical protein